MNKQILTIAALALTLTACRPGPSKVDPTKPQVSVVDGKVRVDQERIEFKSEGKDVLITWQLPSASNFRFPQDGIVFDRKAQEEIDRCQPGKDGVQFTCVNRTKTPGEYKYTIKVQDGSKPLDPLDPFVVNLPK